MKCPLPLIVACNSRSLYKSICYPVFLFVGKSHQIFILHGIIIFFYTFLYNIYSHCIYVASLHLYILAWNSASHIYTQHHFRTFVWNTFSYICLEHPLAMIILLYRSCMSCVSNVMNV